MKVVKLATKGSSSTTWNPEQCVEEFLDQIKSGNIKPTKIMIAFFEDSDDGRLIPSRWFANMNTIETVALIELIKELTMKDWANS